VLGQVLPAGSTKRLDGEREGVASDRPCQSLNSGIMVHKRRRTLSLMLRTARTGVVFKREEAGNLARSKSVELGCRRTWNVEGGTLRQDRRSFPFQRMRGQIHPAPSMHARAATAHHCSQQQELLSLDLPYVYMGLRL
jgi:hypothetical protein